MELDYILLGLLAMGQRSGYDLVRWMDVEGRFLRSSVHHSQVYRCLARMVRSDWVAFRVEGRPAGPDAKVYRLTLVGRQRLLEWARSPYEPSSRFQDPDFIVRLQFGAAVDTKAALAVVDTELTFRRNQVARNRTRNRMLVFTDPIPEVDPIQTQAIFDLAHQEGAAAIDRWIIWLELVRERLEAAMSSTMRMDLA